MIKIATIEIPFNSVYKYEIDKVTGDLVLDRPLNRKVPANYGYLDATLELDSDPLDVFVITNGTPIEPKAKCKIQIEGVFYCKDNGVQDNKLIGVLVGEEFVNDKESQIRQIWMYLNEYKEGFEILSYSDKEEDFTKVVNDAIELYEGQNNANI